MTREIESQPEESRETGEGTRGTEQQNLDDATLDPRAQVEQTGDTRQAESIQQTFTAAVENAKDLASRLPEVRGNLDGVTTGTSDSVGGDEATPITLPSPTIQPEEEGHPPEPPDLDHSPFPEESLAAPESDSLVGRMPKIRDDLDGLTASTGEPGGEEATPINLPGPQASAAQEADVACDGSNKDEALPLDGNVRVSRRFTWSAEDVSATPQPIPNEAGEAGAARTPEKPRQEARFEKPILHKELEDLDSGLGKVDDLGSLIPGQGKNGGIQGGEAPGGDILDGLPGFDGGPGDLKNDLGGPHDEPPPGGFPSAGEAQGGGRNLFWKYNDVPGQEGRVQRARELAAGDVAAPLEYSPVDNKPNKSGISEATLGDYDEVEELRTRFAKGQVEIEKERLKQQESADAVKKFLGLKSEDPDLDTGKDPTVPLSQQMEGARMNPKFDQDLISNYPEDHIEGKQGGGVLSEEHAEAVKRTLDNKAKLANATPKAGAEQVTDPPEHKPGKKSEAGKEGG